MQVTPETLENICKKDLTKDLEQLLATHSLEGVTQALGFSPLRQAVVSLAPGCTEVLLKAGAHPADCALEPLLCEVLYEVKALSAVPYPAQESLRKQALTVMKLLLEYSADPNETDSSGFPPLYYALQMTGQFASVLLEYGANPNTPVPSDPSLPLALAVSLNSPEHVRLLLEYGAGPNAVRPDSPPPLLLAAERLHLFTVQPLLEKGANPWVTDAQGRGVMDLLPPAGNSRMKELHQRVAELLRPYQHAWSLDKELGPAPPLPRLRM